MMTPQEKDKISIQMGKKAGGKSQGLMQAFARRRVKAVHVMLRDDGAADEGSNYTSPFRPIPHLTRRSLAWLVNTKLSFYRLSSNSLYLQNPR